MAFLAWIWGNCFLPMASPSEGLETCAWVAPGPAYFSRSFSWPAPLAGCLQLRRRSAERPCKETCSFIISSTAEHPGILVPSPSRPLCPQSWGFCLPGHPASYCDDNDLPWSWVIATSLQLGWILWKAPAWAGNERALCSQQWIWVVSLSVRLKSKACTV
jgi:hypothetical protein